MLNSTMVISDDEGHIAATQLVSARRILQIYRSAGSGCWSLVALIVACEAVGVVTPLLYREIVNEGVIGRDTKSLALWSGLLLGAGLLNATLRMARASQSARLGGRIATLTRMRLHKVLCDAPWLLFVYMRQGELISRLDSDVTALQASLLAVVTKAFSGLCSLICLLVVLLLLSPKVTIVAMVLLPALMIGGRGINKRMDSVIVRCYQLEAAFRNFILDRFSASGIQLMRLLGRHQLESEVFFASASAIAEHQERRAVLVEAGFSYFLFVSNVAAIIAYGYGGYLVTTGRADIGTIIALAAYLLQLSGPVSSLSATRADLANLRSSIARIDAMSAGSAGSQAREGVLSGTISQITFRAVSFSYPPVESVLPSGLCSTRSAREGASSRLVLDAVSFSVLRGETVAIVGPSGAGKTTIANLIAGFYTATSGNILVNGLDLPQLDLPDLRKRLGIVTQDAFFFNDTILANLRFARPHASAEEIMAALETAHIASLIARLPNGLDTAIGDRGFRLSGGERQRLALARLLLWDPEVTILDEATAHLDTETEAAIQQTLRAALAGRTTIVIAHRLSTVIHANTIIVVAGGRIVEVGTHGHLIAKGGWYSDAYRNQVSHARRGD